MKLRSFILTVRELTNGGSLSITSDRVEQSGHLVIFYLFVYVYIFLCTLAVGNSEEKKVS